MDISNLDCPQFVNFPIEELELVYTMEDSLNIEKHVEDSCIDSSVHNDDEDSFIVIEDSSDTENSISKNEESSDKQHEISSETVKHGKTQSDASDQFVSAIGSFFEDNSCTKDDVIVPIKAEVHSEHVIDNKLQSDAFDHFDCLVAFVSTPISCNRFEVSSDQVKTENIESVVFTHLDSVVDSVSKSLSCEGPDSDSEHIHVEKTSSFVLGQSDCTVYLDAEESPNKEIALSPNIKSEDHAEHIIDTTLKRDVFDHLDSMVDSVSTAISCAGSEVHSEHVRDETVTSDVPDQCVSTVDLVYEAISCEGSENHSEHVLDNLQSDVLDHLDSIVDSVSTAISCAGSEVHSEHVRDEEVPSDVPDQCDNTVDSVSKSISCEGSGAVSEHTNEEKTLNYVFGHSDCTADLDEEESSNKESALSAHIECEVQSFHVEHESLQRDVFRDFESVVDSVSEAISCLGSPADSERNSNEKWANGAFNQSDSGVDLDCETSSSTEKALAAHVESAVCSEHVQDEIMDSKVFGHPDELVSSRNSSAVDDNLVCDKSEVLSEHVKDNSLQGAAFDHLDCVVDSVSTPISCARNEVHSEHVSDEKMQSVPDQCVNIVNLLSKVNSGASEDVTVCDKSEANVDDVTESEEFVSEQTDSTLHLNCESNPSLGHPLEDHVKSEVCSEHSIVEKVQNDVSVELNEMVDSISKANMYELEDILVCVKPDSKNVKDEEVLIDLAPSDKMTNWNCNGNSCAADDILFHLKSEADSEFVVNEKMQNVVSDLIDVFPKQSCSAEDAFVVLSESVTNSDLKYTNDEIVQKEDLNRFCMPIDPKNAEAIAVIEADVNCKDLESMERNNSTAESNQVCDISKISSGSKGAISKNKQDVYVPLAQQVAAFQQKCPERYLSSHVRNFQSTKNWAPPKYVPKSPKLQAAKRHREIKTSVEDVKRYEFHARPFNPKIFEKPMTLEIEKQSTQPKSFTLKTAQRAEAHVKNENLDVKKREFHARPVPKSCHMKENEPEKVKIHTTKPKSPNFALKNREEKWSQRTNKTNDDTKQSNQKVCSKQPKPADFSESVLKHEKKPIEVVPFSFEEREKARMALKQQRSQDLGKENLKPGFKAREMPSFKPPALPSIQRKPATQPEPFTFLSESRISSQKGDTTISDKTSFKPHPDNVLKTFNSKKVLSITEVKEFQLHTEKRAKEWKQLEEIRKTEEMEKQQALEAYKAAKESQEQREIMKMRQNAVHKANPIRAYKNVEIKPCNLVTQPFTPKFETDKRLQLRHDKTGLDKTEIDF